MTRKQVIKPDLETLKTLKKLGGCYATIEDIAAWFGVSRQTVHSTFKKYPALVTAYEDGKSKGRLSLRQNLFRMSKTKLSVAIFLAKNLLGMTDKQEIRGPDGGPIKIVRIENVIVAPKDIDTTGI